MADQTFTFEIKVDSDTGALTVVSDKLKQTSETAKQTQDSFAGLSKEAAGLLKSVLPFATAGGIVSFFKDSVKEAEEENEALRRLSSVLQSHGIAWKTAAESVDEWGRAVQTATRFSDTEAFQTLERMSRATKDLEQAQKASQIAMNLSVSTGKSLADTTELVAMLMQGNERAVMMANREYGNLAGNARTAQQALDSLDKATQNAASTEESFTKTMAQLRSAFSDFQEDIGRGVIPGLTVFVGWMKQLFDSIQMVATAFATMAAVIYVKWSSLMDAMKAALMGNLSAAKEALAQGSAQIDSILVDSAARLKDIETKKTSTTVAEIDKRVRAHAGMSAKAEEDARQQALKEEMIKQQLTQKLLSLGEQTLAKRRAQIDAEYALVKSRIDKEITDENKKNALILQAEQVRLAAQKELDDRYWLDFQDNVNSVWDSTIKGAADAFGKVAIEGGNMGEELQRVFQNMLESFISAVAEMTIRWLAFKALTSSFGGGFGGGFGGAFARGGDFIVDRPTTFIAGEAGAERVQVTPLGRNGAGGGQGGGAGAGTVNVGDININVQVDKLDSNAAKKILENLANEIRTKSGAAIRFALAAQSLADGNSGRSF